jgi:hypothetical protein
VSDSAFEFLWPISLPCRQQSRAHQGAPRQ